MQVPTSAAAATSAPLPTSARTVPEDAPPAAPSKYAADDVRSFPVGAVLPQTTPEAPGSAGGKLWDETTVTPAMVSAIDGARQVVNAEFFGITDAGKGAHLVGALERAARRGVEVNVIADTVSKVALPLGSYQRLQRKIEDAGGRVIDNFRIPFVKDHDDAPGLKHVDHRKVVTIDGTDAFIGGINFIPLEDDFHDSMLQVTGSTAARLASNQLERWKSVGGVISERHAASVEQAMQGVKLAPDDPNEMRVVQNAPQTGDFALSDLYREKIRSAKERLWVSSPGFSDQELMQDLNDAAQRGVDVRVIAPGKPPLGIPVINWVGRSHLRELVEHGASASDIPAVLHRKALIADDDVVFSSFNITGRSKTHDHELGVQTKDPEFVAAIEKVLMDDYASGTKLDPSSKRSWGERFGDFVAQKLKFNY